MDRKCKECGKVGIKANGLCSACYQRWYRANFGVKKGDIEEGKGEVVERVHRMLREYGIKCWYWGECTVCGIQGKPEYEECDAVLNWNTRAERVCKWEKDRDEWAGEIVFCSECDDEWWLDCDSPEDAGYHYCPNCGGKIECGPPNDTADEHVTITEIGGNDG